MDTYTLTDTIQHSHEIEYENLVCDIADHYGINFLDAEKKLDHLLIKHSHYDDHLFGYHIEFCRVLRESAKKYEI